MPITLNGSGTVTGISAGGLPDDCITTAEIAANAVTYAKIGTTEQGQLCKAWVNFNGTGTVAIRASYNVSSITDIGAGDYVVNFTTAFADSNYSVAGAASYSSATWGNAFFLDAATWNVSSVGIKTAAGFSGASLLDSLFCCVSVFR
jgi:hypothetical protein